MYKIVKHMSISGAHSLNLNYESKCQNLHGHNWEIDIYLASETLNENGMVMDFTHIKNKVDCLDHSNINEIVYPLNPTAENIAYWICEQIGPLCYKVAVAETPGNVAIYER